MVRQVSSKGARVTRKYCGVCTKFGNAYKGEYQLREEEKRVIKGWSTLISIRRGHKSTSLAQLCTGSACLSDFSEVRVGRPTLRNCEQIKEKGGRATEEFKRVFEGEGCKHE
jgi:hypothetical protein